MQRIVSIGPEHLRAICNEIGEHLRIILDKDAPPASEYLMSLVAQLDHPAPSCPSIVPDLDNEPEHFLLAVAHPPSSSERVYG